MLCRAHLLDRREGVSEFISASDVNDMICQHHSDAVPAAKAHEDIFRTCLWRPICTGER